MRKFSLLVFFSFWLGMSAFAQSRTLKGKVSDESGKPLQGVTIVPSSSKTGTQTDGDGNFSLSVTGNPTLVITYVGYAAQTIPTDGKEEFSVTLMPASVSADDDVVIIGYASVRRRDLTGSVSSVGSKQLKDIPINSAAQALAGRLAGVQVTGTEGTPNAEVLIRVRGGGLLVRTIRPCLL